MKTYDLGFMNKEQAERVRIALDGKSYVKFRIDTGISPAGVDVTLSTDWDPTWATCETAVAVDAEILTMALYCLATNK